MNYRGVVLPATGGGAFLCGGVALALNCWILAAVSILLALTVFGFWRLQRGERDLRDPPLSPWKDL